MTPVSEKMKNYTGDTGDCSAGFTLIEILISIAMAGIIIAGIYSIFISLNKSYTTQNVTADLQQGVRVSIEIMLYDIRLAGLDQFGTANAGLEDISTTSVRFTSDRIATGDTEPNGVIEDNNFERITYYYDPSGNGSLMQRLYEGSGNQTTSTLVGNVANLTFGYLDADGNPTVDITEVKTITVSLTAREPAGQAGFVTRTYNTRVVCRNLGL